MVRSVLRGVVALSSAIAITSPAWAKFGPVTLWLHNVPQPSPTAVFLIAVACLVVGRLASRKRRDP